MRKVLAGLASACLLTLAPVAAAAGDRTPPTVPGNFHVTGTTSSSVTLGWTASTDNRAVTGYRLTRTHIDGGGLTVRNVGNVLTFTDTPVNAGWTYKYTLRAFDAAGNVSGSTPVVQVLVPTSTGGGGGGSGDAMPVGDLPGWRQIFTDDFTQDVPLGQFPAAATDKWWAYPWPWTGTPTWAKYNPERTTSIHDGLMDVWLHDEIVNGTLEHLISAPVPKINGPTADANQLYGRYAIRFRSDPSPQYHSSYLLWPQSETWPRDGEIDFPEAELSGSICAFTHRQDATSGGDQDAFCTSVPWAGAWHTAVTEWRAGRVTYLLDGQVIGESTSRVPNTPMHWVVQHGGSFAISPPTSTTSAHILIDWVAVYAPA